ncbi:MAG: hypothetical protein WCE48_04250 [Steroidobacteraceae bacterium]
MPVSAILVGMLWANALRAGPADYVSTPAVTRGEPELDFKYGAAGSGAAPTVHAMSLGVGSGLTEWWFSELYFKGARAGTSWRFDAIEWENKFQLTASGKHVLDVGLITEFEYPRDRSEGNELRFGPLLQAQRERWQLNFNPLLTHISGADEGNGTYLEYQWQARYHRGQGLDVGLQGFGDLGRWDHLPAISRQSHRLGPALFGESHVGQSEAIVWDAAVLFGVTQGAPDWNVRLQVEYEL